MVTNSSYVYLGAGYATDIYGQAVAASLTSELEGDKMVLKICKPPRDKDSMVALTWQCCTWVVAVSFSRLFLKMAAGYFSRLFLLKLLPNYDHSSYSCFCNEPSY